MRPTTSASNLFRRALCPGSERMEAGLPEEDSEQSCEGVLLHDYSHHTEYDRAMLKPNQRDLLELADRLTVAVIERVGNSTVPHKQFAEKQLKMKDSEFSGKPDLVRYYATEPFPFALVVDRKFGYAIVERAELNLQLRSYAVMSSDYTSNRLNSVYAAIVQPRAPYDERITIAQYEPEDIEASRVEITQILETAKNPKAKLVAGDEQCRYCKAKLICPAFQKTLSLPVGALKVNEELSKTAREAYFEQKLAEVSDKDLEKLMTAVSLAGMVKPFAWDEARKRITAGTLTNFRLSKPSEKRDIVDPQRAIALLEMAGVATREAILSFCSVPLGKLEEAYRTSHPGLTWQETKAKIDKVLSSVIEKQELAPKILRK